MSNAYKILLIDDNPADRRVFRRFLEQSAAPKFAVFEAGNGQAGLKACREHQPDLVVLDFKLPDTDGIALINEIRKVTRSPLVFVTGQPMPLTQTQAYRFGVVRYLSKDFISSESLQTAVRESLHELGNK